MTTDRFQGIMRSVAETTWGMNGGVDWISRLCSCSLMKARFITESLARESTIKRQLLGSRKSAQAEQTKSA